MTAPARKADLASGPLVTLKCEVCGGEFFATDTVSGRRRKTCGQRCQMKRSGWWGGEKRRAYVTDHLSKIATNVLLYSDEGRAAMAQEVLTALAGEFEKSPDAKPLGLPSTAKTAAVPVLERHVEIAPEAARPGPLRCLDCPRLYSEFGLDVVLPRGQWLEINPRDEGVLCAQCIVKRASRVPRATVAHLVIEVAPPVEDPR